MGTKADYYQLKGMIGDMTPEQKAEIEKASAEVTAIIERSDLARIGFYLAAGNLAMKG